MSYPLLIISFLLLFLKSIEKVCPDGCSNYCPGSNEEYPCSYCYSGYYEIKVFIINVENAKQSIVQLAYQKQ